jgi:hypothetical protein
MLLPPFAVEAPKFSRPLFKRRGRDSWPARCHAVLQSSEGTWPVIGLAHAIRHKQCLLPEELVAPRALKKDAQAGGPRAQSSRFLNAPYIAASISMA